MSWTRAQVWIWLWGYPLLATQLVTQKGAQRKIAMQRLFPCGNTDKYTSTSSLPTSCCPAGVAVGVCWRVCPQQMPCSHFLKYPERPVWRVRLHPKILCTMFVSMSPDRILAYVRKKKKKKSIIKIVFRLELSSTSFKEDHHFFSDF